MSSRGTSRARLAIILALAVLMSSDAALAALACAHSMGCHSGPLGVTKAADSSPETAAPEVQGMACCPNSSEVEMQCADPAMGCCTLEQGGPQSAVVVSKWGPTPARHYPLLSAANTVALPASTRHLDNNRNATSLYIKPVSQKKTDLRI